MPTQNQHQRNFYLDDAHTDLSEHGESEASWHVIWTRSNCENRVAELLGAKGYEVFLPLISEWSSAAGKPSGKKKKVCATPMFRGYLFIKHRIDRTSFLDISNTKGVAHLLGPRWNALAKIAESDIASIQSVMDSHLPLMPHPYLEIGERIIITRGTLKGANGILLKRDCSKGLFVVSVPLLKSSVAVSVNYDDLMPI